MSAVPEGIKKAEPVIAQKFHVCKEFNMKTAGSDIAASCITAGCTSIIVSMIDKSIMEKTLGLRPTIAGGLMDATKTIFTAPQRFFLNTNPKNNYAPVYRLVFLVYSLTYASGNLVQSYYESKRQNFYLEKFSAGSLVNVGLTLYKDNCMLNILPPPGAQKPVPNFSRLLFVIRDSLTVLSSFWIAPLVRDMLVKRTNLSYKSSSDAADLCVPASVQFISTPLHLYGIALKENPTMSQAGLFKIVRRDYMPAVTARICRIVPAFGFGMMAMKRMRSSFQESAEGPNE